MLLTQCPHCEAVYRLGATALSAAAGYVRCGACETVFNALYRLADEPAAHASSSPDAGQRTAQVSAHDVQIPAESVPVQPASRSEEPVVQQADMRPVANDTPARIAARAGDTGHTTPRGEAQVGALDLDDVPAVLREDVARLMRGRRFGASALWLSVILAATALLVAQLAVETRSVWLARYPQLAPHVAQLCAWLGCDIVSARARTGIELVARDVREHPRYAQALLVNATLANSGDSDIAYPVIQLGIYDRNGVVVGMRRFMPREYLDASIDIGAGLRARGSVYVVLEIAGAADAAESFEFKFLEANPAKFF